MGEDACVALVLCEYETPHKRERKDC